MRKTESVSCVWCDLPCSLLRSSLMMELTDVQLLLCQGLHIKTSATNSVSGRVGDTAAG